MPPIAINTQIFYYRSFIILLTIPWLIKIYFSSVEFLHILQLEGYKSDGFSKWINTHLYRVFPRREKIIGVVLSIAGMIAIHMGTRQALFVFAVLWLLLVSLIIFKREKRKSKKPLVYTKRAIRLLTFHNVFLLTEIVFLFWLFYQPSAQVGGYIGRSILFLWSLYIIGLLVPYHMKLVNTLIRPLEKLINSWYFIQARREVREIPDLTIVGITGSYGKTSTKIIAHAVLSSRYPALTTPESYNTPMGICKVINADLTPEHRYFVVEMGARYPGDIQELCTLTPPQIGILTAIGNQHLETFGTPEAIYRTKKELADALPPGGILIINGDDPNCVKIAESVSVKVVRYGIKGKDLDFKAGYIKNTPHGLGFRLKNRQGKTFKVQSRLLGKHNVYNLLAGFALGCVCGIEEHRIVSTLAQINPVPHRLQLMKSQGGATIIDDAYNSNPTGAANALEVLAEFKSGQKILVTPGFVEMGEDEDKENREFGRKAAAACDRVFLVGPKKTEAIRQGLVEAGLDTSRIEVVINLDQVTQRLKDIVRIGDVILFENDLPDQYSEPESAKSG